MEITSYNHHAKTSFLPSVFVLNTRLLVRFESSLLSNQHIAHFAMCKFSRRPGCIEITIKLGGKTLALLSKRYYQTDRKSTRLNSSHLGISYAVFCLKKKKEREDSYAVLPQTTRFTSSRENA